MSGTANRIVKNTGYLYVRIGVSMIISLWTTRLVLNALGSKDFGVYSIVVGAIGMLNFLNTSLTSTTQRFMSYAEGEGMTDRLSQIFNVSIYLHVVIAGMTMVILIIAGLFLFNGILNIPEDRIFAAKVVYSFLIISTVVRMMGIPYEAVLNAHENMRYYAIVGIVETILKLLIALICVITLHDKLIIYGLFMAFLPFIIVTFLASYCRYQYEECIIKPTLARNYELIKEMSSFAGWKLVENISTLITLGGVTVLLNIFGGVLVNAAHGIANQLQGQLLVFSGNMQKALNPVIVKSMGAREEKRMISTATTGNKLSYFLFSIFAIPLIVEMPYILRFWLGNVPEFTILFARLLLIRTLIWQISVVYETCLAATGDIKYYTIIGSIIYLSPLIIGFVLYKNGVPIYTIYLLQILMVIIRTGNVLLFCRDKCGLIIWKVIKELFIPSSLTAIISLATLFIINSLMIESFLRMTFVFVIGFITSSIINYFFLFNKAEKKYIIESCTKFMKLVI